MLSVISTSGKLVVAVELLNAMMAASARLTARTRASRFLLCLLARSLRALVRFILGTRRRYLRLP